MNFNNHSNLEGSHAYLSASNYHWIRYSDEKMIERYANHLATLRGTELHEFAAQAIKLGQKLPKSDKTLNAFVNDAIGFRMSPEVVLKYSLNCFGTADAIRFDEKRKFLRIHDLKTGITPAKMDQLIIYAALFCLEYKYTPEEIEIELRIYQCDNVILYIPKPFEIIEVIDTIVRFDKIIDNMKYGVD